MRSTDKFGADNHLYLQYTSWQNFLASLCNSDWTYIVSTGKVVFLFSEDDKTKYYPVKANAGKPQKLDISEINEIIHAIPRGFSGSDFFNMILDSHPSLLTIGWHGLPTFAALWQVFCEDKNVNDAIEHLRNPKDKKELSLRDINLSNMLKYHYKERMEPFLKELSNYLQLDEKYPMIDWFKAFYLSSNSIIGRKFVQRMAPAIFYDEHGMNQLQVKNDFGISEKNLKLELIGGFKYKHRAGVVRHPVSRFGCQNNSLMSQGKINVKGSWRTNPLAAIKAYAKGGTYGRYLKEKDSELFISRQVRFEDLKLYPKETTVKLCEFLRIPWSETCLHITTNGEESGKVDGTKGFDVTPVYKKHLEYLSTLDYYRIELLNYKNFDVWGYKPKYYDGTKYTAEELEKLFAIPFKIENMTLPKWPGWPDKEACAEFHKWILERAIDIMKNGEKKPVGYKGQPVNLVECLYPDLKPGERLFE
ncbi:MAG: hypothetical protein J6N51_02380 [Selenomonas sp.]|nr:hypothetical protein [Selenomonas sp.]